MELMGAVDEYVDIPVRDVERPFLMPIEDVFSITGRGTVVTGRVEQGVLKVGSAVEVVGLRETRGSVATGVEMFRKLLDEGRAGDNVGVCCGGWVRVRWSVVRCWLLRVRFCRMWGLRRRCMC